MANQELRKKPGTAAPNIAPQPIIMNLLKIGPLVFMTGKLIITLENNRCNQIGESISYMVMIF
jgi:hypothetical protein